MSGAGSSTQARAQTGVDRSPERRRAPRRPRVVSPPGRPVVDQMEKASTLEAARLSREDFDRPGLLANGRLKSPPLEAFE